MDHNHSRKKEKTLKICRDYSAIIDKNIYVLKGDNRELVKCLDINEEGNLLVQRSDGSIKEIISGEVSIRGEKGYV